ncbi:hypothetical protein BC831DRAFT_462705 [Entophlyctis helioformis]|nr:hypothetical protein BC831DRAFT_462705 [Entophlyctis helioformis]
MSVDYSDDFECEDGGDDYDDCSFESFGSQGGGSAEDQQTAPPAHPYDDVATVLLAKLRRNEPQHEPPLKQHAGSTARSGRQPNCLVVRSLMCKLARAEANRLRAQQAAAMKAKANADAAKATRLSPTTPAPLPPQDHLQTIVSRLRFRTLLVSMEQPKLHEYDAVLENAPKERAKHQVNVARQYVASRALHLRNASAAVVSDSAALPAGGRDHIAAIGDILARRPSCEQGVQAVWDAFLHH